MPAISARAVRRLIEDRKRRGLPDTYEPRLTRKDGKVVLGFTKEPGADDQVAAGRGIRLYMAPDVVRDLDHTVVDVQERDGRERLMLVRNRAQAS